MSPLSDPKQRSVTTPSLSRRATAPLAKYSALPQAAYVFVEDSGFAPLHVITAQGDYDIIGTSPPACLFQKICMPLVKGIALHDDSGDSHFFFCPLFKAFFILDSIFINDIILLGNISMILLMLFIASGCCVECFSQLIERTQK